MVRQDPRVHGDIPQIPVGMMFADREDLYNAGVHGTKESGIFGTKDEGGAFSIVLNSGYEDDNDMGETIIYTGEGKGKPADGQAPAGRGSGKNVGQQGPQDMKTPRNAALERNVHTGLEVRVIRGPEGNIKYCPKQGYRYDGLYKVIRAFMEEGKAGFKMCKFELKRSDQFDQDPLPLHITGEGVEDLYWSPDGPEALAAGRLPRDANRGSPSGSPRVPPRTVEQKRQQITGNKKLPANLSFRKSSGPA
ncbi:PUA-like domain-containing protein [Mycena crocata]|nr:PUA-like domain-containing protein [Mycena crocata]